MADPLSALGTAVGVFSLGIQVYQGLTGFYRAWDCHDEEIKKTLENMAHGQQILELLRCKLAKQSSSFPASAVQVKACIAQAQAGFCKLDDVLQKCRQTRVPEDFRERVRNVTKRLSYPFKRETVHDLKSAVAEVERTLALAVQYLHLELTDDQRQSLATLPPLSDAISDQKTDIRSIRATTSETVHKVEIVDQKLAGLQALNSQAGTWTTTMQSGITEFRDKLEEIGTNAQSFALTLQGIEKTVDVLLSRNNEGFHASQNAVQELAQQFKSLQLALVSKPSLQRDVSNELQVSPGEHEHDLRNEGILSDSPKRESMQVRQKAPLCHCLERTTNRFQNLHLCSSTTLFRSTKIHERHHKNCPFFSPAKTRNDTMGLLFRFPYSLLTSALQLSFSLKVGAGGLTISPVLAFHPIVPLDAPAFSLLDKKTLMDRGALRGDGRTPTPYLSSYIELALRKLLQLFKERQASPYDTTEHGETLLNFACKLAYFVDSEAFDSFRWLLLGLLEAGVPLNEISSLPWPWKPLDCIAHASSLRENLSPSFLTLVEELSYLGMEYHAAYEVMGGRMGKVAYMYRLLSNGWAHADTSDQSDLGAAVLERSKSRTIQVLTCSRESLWELNRNGTSVLHLCCDWPEGMAILLEHGAKPLIHQPRKGSRDARCEGYLPLHNAVCSDCLESVSILLQNDSSLPIGAGYDDILRLAIRNGNQGIINLIVHALVDRRRRLQDLAMLLLPLPDLDLLSLDPDRLVDEKASLLQDACFDKDPSKSLLSPGLRVSPRRTTIYHYKCMTAELAERLYTLGFKDINGQDSMNQTPLATIAFHEPRNSRARNSIEVSVRSVEAGLRYAAWLVRKDSEVLRTVQRHGNGDLRNTAAHQFAYNLGLTMSSWVRKCQELGPACESAFMSGLNRESIPFHMLRAFVAADWTDNCVCACCNEGCLPYVSLLKGLAQYKYREMKTWQSLPSDYQWHLSIIKWLYFSQDSDYLVPKPVWIDLVRLETFNALGLTHTCCHLYMEGDGSCLHRIDSSEVKEIRHEEAHLTCELDALMFEFKDELPKGHQSIMTFFEEFWKPRMSEVLSEHKQMRLEPKECAKLRDIGVVLCPDSDVDSPATPLVGPKGESSSIVSEPRGSPFSSLFD